MTFTVTTRKAATANQKHNRRDRETVEREQKRRDEENAKRRREGKKMLPDVRIDPSKTYLNEYWIDEPVGKAYRRIFQKSVDEYNASQRRESRKISSYYKKILSSKTMCPSYEFVLSVGNKNVRPSDAEGKKMLREFVDSWSARNPSLELIGAYYHADERGVPHVHLDFVPVVEHTSGRGMKKTTGLIGAIKQQGQRRGKDFLKRDEEGRVVKDKYGKPVPMSRLDIEKEWTREQNEALERVVRSFGYMVEHPERGKKVEHLSIDDYGEVKDAVSELQKERDDVMRERRQLEQTEAQLDRFFDLSGGHDSKTGKRLTLRDVYEKFINRDDEREANPHPYRPKGSGDDFSK